ncbi:MAG: hypothetical protein AAGC67_21295 [Myxococcota bacterium]
MRLRLLAFLPVAGLITFLLLLSASSLVSALERSVVPDEIPGPMRITKYETVCEGLFRELHALSHEVAACTGQSACVDSPLLCPAALDDEIDHTYRRLRTALHEQCDFPLRLIDYAWQGPSDSIAQRTAMLESTRPHAAHGEPSLFVDATCGERHDWLEAAASGEAEPARFYF